MDAQEVLDRISHEPRGRATFKHLARVLRVRGKTYAALAQNLKALVADGRLVEYRRGHYSLPGVDTEYVAGRFSLHPDGYGFVTPDRPIPGVGGDIFIPPDATAHAMHHDRVVVRLGRIPDDGRADGAIQRVLGRTRTLVVGRFHFSNRGSYVVPHDDRIRQNIQIGAGRELPPPDARDERLGDVKAPEIRRAEDLDGWIVNVEVTQLPTRSLDARGQVVEVLGRPGDFGLDVEIIIRKYHLPHRFPARAMQEAEDIQKGVGDRDPAGRRDFRNLEIVTIDGETARDFDDAVWVDRLDNGNFALQVHIADVSHYVRPGAALDEEARLRGTSVYFPDRAVPMLPAELSTDICSLNPHVDRLVVSALLEIDNHGETIGAEFCRGVIRSVERMTYTSVNRVLEGDTEQRERYRPLVGRFELMEELAMILLQRRERRGSIDFDLPDPLIEFDEEGMMQSITQAERNIAHRMIEEFMLAANEAVARRMEQSDVPALYRIHEKPDPERVLLFEQLLAPFGYTLGTELAVKRFGYTERRRDGSKRRRQIDVPGGDLKISPRHYQKLIAKLDGRPEGRVLLLQMLRSLRQARYSETNAGHFALATPTYTHFTSPIRRYPDLIVHRILTALLEEGARSPYGEGGSEGPYRESQLVTIANESSFTERRAADAERELIDWKKARFMEQHLGEEYAALVVSVTRFGFFVELEELFVEGLVRLESFRDDRYHYRENLQAIVGERSQRQFTIGDRIRVRVDRVSYDEMRPEFSWVDPGVERGGGRPRKQAERRRRRPLVG